MIYKLSLILTLVLQTALLQAQSPEVISRVKGEVVKLSEDPLVKTGFLGFSLRGPDGKALVSFNADKALTPASNLKVVTTATALKSLGEDFRFETKIYYTGKIESGVLKGNLIIKGGGDPSLGASRINDNPDSKELMSIWSDKIRQAGIRKIEGTVVQDYSIFSKNSLPDGWSWNDMGNYYGAGAGGLNINENLYYLVFKPGLKTGDSTTILRTEPALPDMVFDNQVKTGMVGSGDNAYIYGAPFSDYRYISGTIPAGVSEFSIKGSLPDPAFSCVLLLYESLKDNGIEVSKAPESSVRSNCKLSEKDASLIHIHYSPTLKDLIFYTNNFSINLYAECIFNIIAVKKGTGYSSQLILDYWKSRGFNTTGVFISDGSGLSPQNGIKVSFMTELLYSMSKDTSAFASFLKSLPIAGESGTLTRFCKGTKAEKRVYAKSGTLSKVTGYSGYIKSKDGKTYYSFSIIVNDFDGKGSAVNKKIEQIMVSLSDL